MQNAQENNAGATERERDTSQCRKQSLAKKWLFRERGLVVKPMANTASGGQCKNNGQVGTHRTKEEGTQNNGSAQWQMMGPWKDTRKHAATGYGVAQFCFDHEGEPKKGEYGTAAAKRDCQTRSKKVKCSF